ncbi:hypothetical protein HDU76_003868 [Blyttiomyces sp. JEL0837]|nr:hypothetical protein HDU76_003868 [Blyttiomyces sp. JEL0837]
MSETEPTRQMNLDCVADLAVRHLPIKAEMAKDLAVLLQISHEQLQITLAGIATRRFQKAQLLEEMASQAANDDDIDSLEPHLPPLPGRIEALPSLNRLFPITKDSNKEIVRASNMSEVMEILGSITGILHYHGAWNNSFSILEYGVNLDHGRKFCDLSRTPSFYTTTSLCLAIRTAYRKAYQIENGEAWLMIFKLQQPDFTIQIEPPSDRLRQFVLQTTMNILILLRNLQTCQQQMASKHSLVAYSNLVKRVDEVKFANEVSQVAWRTPRQFDSYPAVIHLDFDLEDFINIKTELV